MPEAEVNAPSFGRVGGEGGRRPEILRRRVGECARVDQRTRLREVDDPLSKLRIFIDNHLSFFAANMAEMKVLSHEAESLAGDLHAHVSTKKDKYTRLARKILKEIQQQESDRPQIDLTVATYALFGMMNWIYNWYDPQGKLKVSELVDNVTRLFLHGFVAGSPPSELNSAAKRPIEPFSVWRGSVAGDGE